MISVIVSYPNGEREEVILAGIPRVGESIRLNHGDPTSRSAYIVEHLIWTEGGGAGKRDAEVILTVRKRTDPP